MKRKRRKTTPVVRQELTGWRCLECKWTCASFHGIPRKCGKCGIGNMWLVQTFGKVINNGYSDSIHQQD